MAHRCANPDLFLSGLPGDISAGKVRSFFGHEMIDVSFTEVVRQNPATASAFVRLADSADVERAVEALNLFKIDETHVLRVRRYVPKPKVTVRHETDNSKCWARAVAGETAEVQQ